jgi:hypothetical protein
MERKRALEKLVYKANDNRLRLSESFDDGSKLLVAAERMHLEGIVSKRRDAPYRSGRMCDWIKVKCATWRVTRGINAQTCSCRIGARSKRADVFLGGNALNRSTRRGSRSSPWNSRAYSLERSSRSIPCGAPLPSLRALPAGTGLLWRPGVGLRVGLRMAAPPRTRHRKSILVAPLPRLPLRLVTRPGGRALARPLPSGLPQKPGASQADQLSSCAALHGYGAKPCGTAEPTLR